MEFKRTFLVGARRHRAFLAVASVAAFLRLIGISYGLPAVFNGDEPHHVDVAVSFGRGSLNPGVFKYPAFWMYVLFAAYGAWFALWSGAGLLRSPQQFGELFVWRPGGFYLIGRLLATLFSVGGLWWVYRVGSLAAGRTTGVLAAALLAVSPWMVESSHAVKPDSLMFFLAGWAWWQAVGYLERGDARRLFRCAAGTGLCVASQYTAAPLAVLIPTVWWARRSRRPGRGDGAGVLLAASGIVALAFLAGNPFSLLDLSTFLRDLKDGWAAYGSGHAMAAGRLPFYNLLRFTAPLPLGALAMSLGLAWFWKRRPWHLYCMLVPCLATALFFSRQVVGGNARYLYSVFPAAAVLMAAGVRAVTDRRGSPVAGVRSRWAAWLLLLLPGVWASWSYDKDLLLVDTRSLASSWVAENLPAGTRILSDHDADSPRIAMSRDFALGLYERMRSTGHPRRRYYELMASGHPGGGYEVYQVLREASELLTGPWHASWSAAGRPVMDVREGLSAARAAGIEVVILTDFGLAHNQDEPYVRQTRAQGRRLAEFAPESGRIRGPHIEIYRIGPGR